MADDEQGNSDIQEQWDKAHEKVAALEDDPPKDLEEWPDDQAKYVTFGGGEGDHGYDEGPEKNLGPSSVKRHEDGSVEVDGELVDNPEDHKMESIRGNSDHPADN
jgi:hypothetical protein